MNKKQVAVYFIMNMIVQNILLNMIDLFLLSENALDLLGNFVFAVIASSFWTSIAVYANRKAKSIQISATSSN